MPTAFVAIKQAYDVLSNQDRRAGLRPRGPGRRPWMRSNPRSCVVQPAAYPAAPATDLRQPRFSDLPPGGLGWGRACSCAFASIRSVAHLLATPRTVREEIRPNAAIVAPLSPSAHQAVLYGPAPLHLAGTPNFYVIPAASPATCCGTWTPSATCLVPLGQLPPFSSVQAVRLVRQNGMLEVLLNDQGNGFISADHLTPGNAAAARRAYCGYNAGPTPTNGELLARHGQGNGKLMVENRAMQPAVVKLRDAGRCGVPWRCFSARAAVPNSMGCRRAITTWNSRSASCGAERATRSRRGCGRCGWIRRSVCRTTRIWWCRPIPACPMPDDFRSGI